MRFRKPGSCPSYFCENERKRVDKRKERESKLNDVTQECVCGGVGGEGVVGY